MVLAGSLGDVFARSGEKVSKRRPDGEAEVFLACRSQKLIVPAGQWHHAELVLPALPAGARYARIALKGMLKDIYHHQDPENQHIGAKFAKPRVAWGSQRRVTGKAAVLFCSGGQNPVSPSTLNATNSIVTVLEDSADA